MIDFLVKWNLSSKEVLFRSAAMADLQIHDRAYLFQSADGSVTETGVDLSDGGKLFCVGDVICPDFTSGKSRYIHDCITNNRIKEIGGFYYLIQYNCRGGLSIISGTFNVLPIYYFRTGDTVYVSSSTKLIRKGCRLQFNPDKQYLLERALFNYALFDRTYWEGMKTVKAHHSLRLSDVCLETAYWDPTDYLVSQPRKGSLVLEEISNWFCKSVKKYLPENMYALSFTGGFDGRTLLAVSLQNKKRFLAYSFGSRESDDITLPLKQSESLGIDFLPIYLEDDYIRYHSYEDGLELIRVTEGFASFARAHYLYSAKLLSSHTSYMITGNFGSEVFRAAHNPGVVISKAIFDVIGATNIDEIPRLISSSEKLPYLIRANFTREMESLIDDLVKYQDEFRGIDPNSKLYIYNMNEMYRKYFGPEIVMQSKYLTNRSPFLDYGFLEKLMGTLYCGAYSDYSTENPIKRFKGQLPYPYIINRAYPQLLNLPTNKGYKPSDLTSPLGKLKLVQNLIRKKLRATVTDADPFSVGAAFDLSKEQYLKVKILADLYNQELIKNQVRAAKTCSDLDALINVLSVNQYLNMELEG